MKKEGVTTHFCCIAVLRPPHRILLCINAVVFRTQLEGWNENKNMCRENLSLHNYTHAGVLQFL